MSFIVPEMRRKVQPGDKFGRLTVAGVPFYFGASSPVSPHVVCKCECGTDYFTGVRQLRRGKTKSCGCLQREKASITAKTHQFRHGQSKTKLYKVWKSMRKRCANPNDRDFQRYGGRGIFVCDEWNEFQSFKDWSDASGYSEGLEIDRSDNDGPYSPGNCKWSTRSEQCNNKSSNRMLIAFGETKTVTQWSMDKRCVVTARCLTARLRYMWNPEAAITTPRRGTALQ